MRAELGGGTEWAWEGKVSGGNYIEKGTYSKADAEEGCDEDYTEGKGERSVKEIESTLQKMLKHSAFSNVQNWELLVSPRVPWHKDSLPI